MANLIPEIAKMLGVELGEEFKVRSIFEGSPNNKIYHFGTKELFYTHEKNQNKIKEWYLNQKRKDDVIISASPEFLLKPICGILGIDNLIATKVELSSGKFLSKNCQGVEKVVRFKELFSEAEIEAFYSDSKSDIYMAKLATKAFRVKKNSIMDWEQG